MRFVWGDWRRSTGPSLLKQHLQWDPLEERRARARVLMLHKIVYNYVAIPISLFPVTHSTMTTRGAPTKFFIPHANSYAYKSTFVQAAPSLWNSLPASLVKISDTDAFRSSLATVRLTQ